MKGIKASSNYYDIKSLEQLSRTNFGWTELKLDTLIVRSAEPVQNHVLLGSNAIDLTHPKWPLMTYKMKL